MPLLGLAGDGDSRRGETSYDITRDLQPITQVTSIFYVVYHSPTLPVKSIKELIAYAKANPGKLNYGTSGTGSLQHFAGELLSHLAGIRMVQVPYKGSANIVQAMLANEVQLGFNSMFSVRPQVQAGRLRWIAMTGGKRSPLVDLPTVAESGCPATKSRSGTESSRPKSAGAHREQAVCGDRRSASGAGRRAAAHRGWLGHQRNDTG